MKTWGQWVIDIASDMGVECDDDKEIDTILWSFTAFPFAGTDYCEPQVREYFEHKKAGTIPELWARIEKEMAEASNVGLAKREAEEQNDY